MKSYLFISPSDLFGSLPLKGSATSFLKPGDLRLGIDDDTHIWELELPLTALPEDESWAELTLALEQSLRKMLDNLPEEGRPKILLSPLYEKGSAPSPLEFFRVHFKEIMNYAFAFCGHKAALIDQHHALENGSDVSLEVDGELTAKEAVGAKVDAKLTELLGVCLGFAGKVKIVPGDFSSEHDQEKEKEEAEIAAKLAKQKEEQARVVYGEGVIPSKFTVTAMRDLYGKEGGRQKVLVEGKVFSYANEESERRPNTAFLTDGENAVAVKIFKMPKWGSQEKIFVGEIKEGEWLKVLGSLDTDQRSGELFLRAETIVRADDPTPPEKSAEHRVELHAHTKMSAMDALTEVNDLIARAKFWGHPAVGVTDHGNVHIYPDAYKQAKKLGIRLLFGVEGYLVNIPSEELKKRLESKNSGGLSKQDASDIKANTYHIILYAKNRKGLHNIYDLVSVSHTEYFYSHPLIPRDVLEQYREGLVIGGACVAGELFNLVLKEDAGQISSEEFDKRFAEAQNLYDYFEIQPLGNNVFLKSKVEYPKIKTNDDLIRLNKKIVELGEKFGKPVCATCDVHILEEKDALARKILQVGQGYDDETEAPLYFRSTDKMLEEFSYLGEEKAKEIVITNTNKIAESLEDLQPIPDGFHPPKVENAEQRLRDLCYGKLHAVYGENPHKIPLMRLEREIGSIIENHYADLYMLAQMLVQKSLSDGYIVGSRGSVGSSFVAFLSGITEVNSLPAHYVCPKCHKTEFVGYDDEGEPRATPLNGITQTIGIDLPDRKCPACGETMGRFGFDIPFETFVGYKGDKTPDIDLNFAGEYQSQAHRYTEKLFGIENVYRAGTIATLQSKTAYGFVMKYLDETGLKMSAAMKEYIIFQLVGVKRTTGQHPGGMIILPKGELITDFCPVQYPADKKDAQNKITHFDYHKMESQLLKLDILGHDVPTQIKLLSDYLGFDVTKLELNDPAMLSLFTSVEALRVKPEDIDSNTGTLGIPEFGTNFVRGMLMDAKPKNIEDLIRISGLSHGTNVWLDNAQSLITNLKLTLSDVICTRDDIMLYLKGRGMEPFHAFKIMESVRKGKGLKPEDEEAMGKVKVPDWYVDSCKKIKYMFPKAHAVAYVLNAARIAYCKVHYPLAFYATYFSIKRDHLNSTLVSKGLKAVRQELYALRNKGKDATANDQASIEILELAQEMYARGFEMMPLDIYKSHPTKCLIKDGKILPPLNSIPGLSEAVAASIVKAREEVGTFSNQEEFQRLVGCNSTLLAAMNKDGLLGDMPESSQTDFFSMFSSPAPKKAEEKAPEAKAEQEEYVKPNLLTPKPEPKVQENAPAPPPPEEPKAEPEPEPDTQLSLF